MSRYSVHVRRLTGLAGTEIETLLEKMKTVSTVEKQRIIDTAFLILKFLMTRQKTIGGNKSRYTNREVDPPLVRARASVSQVKAWN